MVVMVIIALMTSFAIPGLRTAFFTDQLKTTTRKILGLVAEASQEAISRHADYFLYFDLEQNSISSISGDGLQDSADDRVPSGKELNITDAVQLVDVESVHGGKQTLGRAVVRFSKKGYVDKTLIHLRSENGDDMTIMLSPFLGVTKIFDSYIELEDDQLRY